MPLVVPEVNPRVARGHHGFVANPNCSTILLVVALWPLHRAAGLRGRRGVDLPGGVGRRAAGDARTARGDRRGAAG